ncbi:MAG TPA: hypothetical protein VFP84_35305 [Kofleriaceae bacterium]|nr:hypothetical protein [Kofleriaceae bacterium]
MKRAACRAVLAALVTLAACADPQPAAPRAVEAWTPPPRAPWYDPQPEPLPAAQFLDPVAARYHMRAHFHDLRMIEQLLVAGKLDEGRALAYLLTTAPDDPGLAPWADHARDVREVATSLSQAPGLDEALRREAKVAVECAGCHAAAQARILFAPARAVPPAGATPALRMARHVWAADRLWEGLVGPDEERWRAGLGVLADSPLPFTPRSDAPMLAAALQRAAQAQLAARATTSLDERGAAYGEVLVLCAACHATLHARVR